MSLIAPGNNSSAYLIGLLGELDWCCKAHRIVPATNQEQWLHGKRRTINWRAGWSYHHHTPEATETQRCLDVLTITHLATARAGFSKTNPLKGCTLNKHHLSGKAWHCPHDLSSSGYLQEVFPLPDVNSLQCFVKPFHLFVCRLL